MKTSLQLSKEKKQETKNLEAVYSFINKLENKIGDVITISADYGLDNLGDSQLIELEIWNKEGTMTIAGGIALYVIDGEITNGKSVSEEIRKEIETDLEIENKINSLSPGDWYYIDWYDCYNYSFHIVKKDDYIDSDINKPGQMWRYTEKK